MALFVASAQPRYARHAVAELKALDPRCGGVRLLAEGLFVLASGLERDSFLARVQEREPVFLHHLHPADQVVPLAGALADLERLAAAAADLLAGAALAPGEPVGIQVRRLGEVGPYSRYAVKAALDPLVAAAGGTPTTRAPARVLSATLVRGEALVGLSTAAQNLSPWAGGEVLFAAAGSVSRAGFKLLEALAKFAPALPSGGTALDLGAAPGGWTQVLLERGLRVIAVDTADLDPRLEGHPNLDYRRQNAREVQVADSSLDLLTCDMNWEPMATARVVGALGARALRPGGQGILTVKLMGRQPIRTYKEAARVLTEAGLALRQAKQLYHNRDEVTLLFER